MAEQLFGIAIGTSAPPAEAGDLLTSFLRVKGFGEPPAKYDSAGEYLRLVLFGRGDGGCWCLLEDQKSSRLSLVAELARYARRDFDVFEVSGIEKPVRSPDGDLGYPIDVQAHHVTPEGSLTPPTLEAAIEASDTYQAQGDFYETVSFVLWNATEGELPRSPGAAFRLTFYRSQSSGLSPRLQGIINNVEAASSVALQSIDGHQFLKLSLPSASRLVRVTSDELQQLRAASSKIP